jgi:hypothetical protein
VSLRRLKVILFFRILIVSLSLVLLFFEAWRFLIITPSLFFQNTCTISLLSYWAGRSLNGLLRTQRPCWFAPLRLDTNSAHSHARSSTLLQPNGAFFFFFLEWL